MGLLITISLRRIHALKYHSEYEIFMYYKQHLSTFVLISPQILEGFHYILNHYHHFHNICRGGSLEIPFCLKFDKYIHSLIMK